MLKQEIDKQLSLDLKLKHWQKINLYKLNNYDIMNM